MAISKAVTRALSANKKDIKKGSKIMMDAKKQMELGRKKLLSAEKTWVRKAEALATEGRKLNSPRLRTAASKHKQSAIGMTDKILKSMGR